MKILTKKLTPLNDSLPSPERIDEAEGIETPTRADLRELPLDTIIQFYGIHPDSVYICQLTGTDTERKIKIWFKGRANCAIGSIDTMIAMKGAAGFDGAERGIMEVGKNYVLPHFYYDEHRHLTLNYQVRTEVYTKIFMKKP